MQPASVKELLNDNYVLLTGVSGYVGGGLLQRILIVDPGPKKVFVLIRKKADADPRERLEQIISTPLFSTTPPEKFQKIHLIPCNIAEPNLGISEEDRNLLISQCTLVFHSAAVTSFAASLETATKVNILGTKYLLDMAKAMPNCRAMIHVSSISANVTKNGPLSIEEKIYPSPYDPIDFIETFKKLSPKELSRRTEELLDDHFSTYPFTKQLAENLFVKERGHVPIAIVRPGIVFNSWREPIPGWINALDNAALGCLVGIANGFFRSVNARENVVQFLIPLDFSVSTILAAAMKLIGEPRKLHVYHNVSSPSNPITWGQYLAYSNQFGIKYPSEWMMWYPNAKLRLGWRFYVVTRVFQVIPARIFYYAGRLVGSDIGKRMMTIQEKFVKGCAFLEYFSRKEICFFDTNNATLKDVVPEEEREIHPIDTVQIDWEKYIEACYLGLRRFTIINEPVVTRKARFKLTSFKIISYCAPIVFCILLWFLLNLIGCPTVIGGILSVFVVLFLTFL